MRPRPAAVGYLRSDISRTSQQWDECQVLHLARRFGYELLKTVVFSSQTDQQMDRLRGLVSKLDVEAIIVPSLAHFDNEQVPDELVQLADVITVSPEETYARYLIPKDTYTLPGQSNRAK